MFVEKLSIRRAYLARKRLLRIALIPLLAPLFLIGWLLTFSGQKKSESKKSNQKLAEKSKEDPLEIGLLPEAVIDREPIEVPLKTESSK